MTKKTKEKTSPRETTPPNTPTRPTSFQFSQWLSPDSRQLALTCPRLELFELSLTLTNISLKKNISFDLNTRVNFAEAVLNTLRAIYYSITDRSGDSESVSITAAIIKEGKTGKKTKGHFHAIKANDILSKIQKTLKALNKWRNLFADPNCNLSRELLDQFITYFQAQAKTLTKQLKTIPDNQFNSNNKPVLHSPPEKTSPEKRIIQRYHTEQLPHTPKKPTPHSLKIRNSISEIANKMQSIKSGKEALPSLKTTTQKKEHVKGSARKLNFDNCVQKQKPLTPLSERKPVQFSFTMNPHKRKNFGPSSLFQLPKKQTHKTNSSSNINTLNNL